MTSPRHRRPWLPPLLGCLAVFGVAAAVMSYLFLVEWVDVDDALPPEARLAFDAAILESGGGVPYIEIAGDGTVTVRREQEGLEFDDFDTLTLLVWSSSEEKLLRVDYPRWFVRIKTMSSFNLGTMISVARGDWGHLDLSVTFDDLRRRGPGLLLDHRNENGSRILLWTSMKDGGPDRE